MHVLQQSIHVWLLGRSSCSPPYTKELLHGLSVYSSVVLFLPFSFSAFISTRSTSPSWTSCRWTRWSLCRARGCVTSSSSPALAWSGWPARQTRRRPRARARRPHSACPWWGCLVGLKIFGARAWSTDRRSRSHDLEEMIKVLKFLFVKKITTGQPRPRFNLFSVFSEDKQFYTFYTKLMWKYPSTIRWWDSNRQPSDCKCHSITSRPWLPPNFKMP